MRPLADSPGKQRILFFLAGAGFAFVCGFIQYKWMDMVPYDAFDQQPGWVKGLQGLVGWLPWIAFLVVLVLRFVKGRRVRVVFYFLGTAIPTLLLIGWLFLSNSVPISAITRSLVLRPGEIRNTSNTTTCRLLGYAW